MHFPLDFYDYLDKNTLIEIKGGTERHSFLQIWMVQIDKRVFARTWNKSKKSWFTAFLETGKGQIKYGDKIIHGRGVKLKSDDKIHELINQAYLKKYTQAENIIYAKGITQAEYSNYTMEFFPY